MIRSREEKKDNYLTSPVTVGEWTRDRWWGMIMFEPWVTHSERKFCCYVFGGGGIFLDSRDLKVAIASKEVSVYPLE